jgi:proton-translocating NADH-quinone oxidoreductase chain N
MPISLFLPELTLGLAALILFGFTLAPGRQATLQILASSLALLCLAAAVAAFGQEGMLFFDSYRVDLFSQLFKILIVLGLLLVIRSGPGLLGIEERLRAEYYLFLFVAAFGMVMLASAHELLTILLSLEIATFAMYVVIPFRHPKEGQRVHVEAAIKYLLFGAVASGVLLYGMSYLFGLGHSTYLQQLATVLPVLLSAQPLATIAMIMLLCGFFYKLALFPMHFLTPDVYQGAANETTAFIATLPKIAVVAVIIRLVTLAGAGAERLTWALAAFAVLSMTVGNLSALVQSDLKRLLAYSSIAHAGYVMIGILSVNRLGLAAAIYYMVGYLLLNLACFFVIYQLARRGENPTFDHLRGLYRRSPLLAATLAAGAFGLTGIPPTIGFTGKFLIFTAALERGYLALVILAVINSAISAFFYLKMVRAAYRPEEAPGEKIVLPVAEAVLSLFLLVAILLGGILPQSVIALAEQAVAGLH